MPIEYTYCPYCGTTLVTKFVFNGNRAVCTDCGFVHFHDPKVAVIGLVTTDELVLLIRRGVDPAKGKWALPGGYMDAGEMPEQALSRELLEEVGLQITIGEILNIYPIAVSARIAGGIVIAYSANPQANGVPELHVSDDADEAAWFGADELPDDIAFESSNELLAKWRQGRLTPIIHDWHKEAGA